MERFKALGLDRVAAGAVLYNGEQRVKIQGVHIFNPLHVEDLWETLTSPAERKTP